jgi:DGQHR domain-containing protein
MGKGEDLNQRVWTLFHKAGFATKPNPSDPAEYSVRLADGRPRPVDLLARATNLGVTILGSNKARDKVKSFSAHIHDLVRLKEAEGANCALFVSGEKEMQQAERDYAAKNGVQVWDERELAYYEVVVDALATQAKYEIISSLGIQTTEEALKVTVLGLRLEQPSPRAPTKTEMYVFTLPAEKLLKTCVVLRKARGSANAYQRILSRKRLPKIGGFLRTPDALIPTNLVVHFGDDLVVDEVGGELKDVGGRRISLTRQGHQLVSLTFPLKYGSLELIDGQHRLFGFVHALESASDFDLVVLGLRNLEERRRSRTFVAINENARRVDPNLVSFLRYTDEERVCQHNADLMAIKIVVTLNTLSPFRGLIRLLDFGRQRLTLKGVSGYDLRGLVSPRGLLRQLYPENTSEQYTRALRTYFSSVKASFRKEWDDPETYIVATNRGITAFIKLLRSILKTEEQQVTPEIAGIYLSALKQNWSGTWKTAELKTAYVGSQGWKRFHHEMVRSIRKKYRGFRE